MDYAAQIIPAGDFPVVVGVTLVIGTAYIGINAMADILQQSLTREPRT
jgi:ABC-type dipeptide/oligopeptide/nickel transport system permease component